MSNDPEIDLEMMDLVADDPVPSIAEQFKDDPPVHPEFKPNHRGAIEIADDPCPVSVCPSVLELTQPQTPQEIFDRDYNGNHTEWIPEYGDGVEVIEPV